jgi:hypothetical protein
VVPASLVPDRSTTQSKPESTDETVTTNGRLRPNIIRITTRTPQGTDLGGADRDLREQHDENGAMLSASHESLESPFVSEDTLQIFE